MKFFNWGKREDEETAVGWHESVTPGVASPPPDQPPSDRPQPPSSGDPQVATRDVDVEHLREQVREMLQTCYDPEIPVDIYELGLIYDIAIDPSRMVTVQMTLTSPNCPVAEALPMEVEAKVRSVPGVMDARVEIVWDPPWNPEMMSEAARLDLGFF